jgi:hypothetical protein
MMRHMTEDTNMTPPDPGPQTTHIHIRRATSPLRASPSRHLLALALFALVALLTVAPVLPDPSGLAIGHEKNDVWNHIWGYWYVWASLTQGELPLHTELLAWPFGGSLWFIDTWGALVTLPVQWIWGATVAYNASYLASFLFAGIACYLLAYRELRCWSAALIAGLALQSTPHLLAQAYNGISESMSVGWLPLSLLALGWASERASPGRWAVAGAVTAVATFANWYYGVFAALIALVYLPRLLRAVRADPRPLRWLGCLAAAALAFAALLTPPALAFYSSMAAPDAVVTRDPRFVWMTLVHHNMTDVLAFFVPGDFYSPDLHELYDEDLIVVVYLGYTLLLPALAVLFLPIRSKAWPWLVAALVFFLLALGPFLFWNGSYVELGQGWIPLPFLGLHKALPLFSRISHAYRFTVGVTLALALVGAWGLRWLALRHGPRWALLAALLLGLGRVAESWYASPAVMPLPAASTATTPLYATLGEGAVLDLPVSRQVLDRSRYLMGQAVHGQPIPYGLNDPSPRYLYSNRFTRYIIALERNPIAFLPPSLPYLDLALGSEAAAASGLRSIVVHMDEYPRQQLPKILQVLDMVAEPVTESDGIRVYRLEPTPPAGDTP